MGNFRLYLRALMVLVQSLCCLCSHFVLDVKCVSPLCKDQARAILDTMNINTDPCEDFYQYACGLYSEKYMVPEGRYLWDTFTSLQQKSDNTVKEILELPVTATDPESLIKAKNMYSSCMDTETLEKKGIGPLVNAINSWGGFPMLNPLWNGSFSWDAIGNYVAESGIQLMFEVNVQSAFTNDSNNILFFSKLETSNIFSNDIQGVDINSLEFREYIFKVVSRLQESFGSTVSRESIQNDIKDVLKFMSILMSSGETKTGIYSIKDLQDVTDTNLLTYKIEWLKLLQSTFKYSNVILKPDDLINMNTSDALDVLQLIYNTNPKIIANYIILRLLIATSPATDSFMYNTAVSFYQQQEAVPSNYSRWFHCIRKVTDYPNVGLSMAIAYYYKTNMFDLKKLDLAMDLVNSLKEGFKDLMFSDAWIDNQTREMAEEKLDNMLLLLGFPDWLISESAVDDYYKELQIVSGDHYGNMLSLNKFLQAKNQEEMNKSRNRSQWTQSPFTVNAVYNTLNNRMTFPAAIMEEPFFSASKISILDYARIGTVIGHEITHGFDSTGRWFDKEGFMGIWMTTESSSQFDTEQQCFVEQYNNYLIPEINSTVNGSITERENTADNGGLRESYRTFKKLISHHSVAQGFISPHLPGIEQYTSDQLFFLGYATMWCRSDTVEGLMKYSTDEHSPSRFRVVGTLSNMNEFSEAWNCPINSAMNPLKKCVLW